MEPGDKLWIGDLPADIDTETLQTIFSAYGTISEVYVLPPKNEGQKGAALVTFGSVQEAQWIVENLNGNMPEGLQEPVVAKYASQGRDKGGAGKGGAGKGGTGGGAGWGKDGGGGKGVGKDSWGPYGGAKGGKGGGGGFAGGCDMKTMLTGLGKGGYLPGSTGKVPDECQVYVKGLPSDTTDFDLYKLMSPFGAIAPRGVKAMLNEDGTCTSVGFVDFLDAGVAQQVIQTLTGCILPDGTSLFLKTKSPGKGKKGGGKGKAEEGL